MSARRALDRRKLKAKPTLQKEWVSLDAGDVCAWEMTAAEMLDLGQRSARPSIDPRGGVDTTAAAVFLTMYCTHEGDEEDSPRVWDDATLSEIHGLRGEEFARLQQAIQRVNGNAAESIEETRGFSSATGAPKPSGSRSSASSNSTGSPESLTTSAITS